MDVDKYLETHPQAVVLARCLKCGYIGTAKAVSPISKSGYLVACKVCSSYDITILLVLERTPDEYFKIIYKKRK